MIPRIPICVKGVVIGFFVHRSMLAHSPATVHTSFLLLAAGIGIVFEILAAVVFKMRGIVEFTVLHIVYLLAFGWIMPMLWTV